MVAEFTLAKRYTLLVFVGKLKPLGRSFNGNSNLLNTYDDYTHNIMIRLKIFVIKRNTITLILPVSLLYRKKYFQKKLRNQIIAYTFAIK